MLWPFVVEVNPDSWPSDRVKLTNGEWHTARIAAPTVDGGRSQLDSGQGGRELRAGPGWPFPATGRGERDAVAELGR